MGAGAGAGAVLEPVAASDRTRAAGGLAGGQITSDHFGRMFQLPAFAEPSDELTAALTDLGKPGGLLDAKDDLAKGPVALITDQSLLAGNRDNTTQTAGTTFLGQFIDHDITLDQGSKLGLPTDPTTSKNNRTPALDLDSVYGGGPLVSPQLYRTDDPAKFRVESGGLFEDLPRSPTTLQAVLRDRRNDEHMIIAGLHVAFLIFHNSVVDRLRTEGVENEFDEARRIVRWHYQWIVVHEFLPQLVGPAMVDDVFGGGRKYYTSAIGYMPVEFQGAAFRVGHSMVRPSYRANLAGDAGKPFFGFVFDPAQPEGESDPADLRGGARALRRFIGWQTFFDFGDGEVKPNKRIDTHISTPLMTLPAAAIRAFGNGPTSLPARNLLRQVTWSMPSGQAIAKQLGVPVLSSADLSELRSYSLGLERSTPLWYYVLKEAEVEADGLRMGPVGGRIVAEVLIGLLQNDPTSYVAVAPDWRPSLPSTAGTGEFRMVDLLTVAGVDPASRGQ
ncbi:peroxidase family protein [Kribbella caucasensis]|uniref:peroxidase family protein n=1 Tax=Kribbella caucasensis TaxID=2512215 RepID=UPI00105F632E|nr:heme peroxidase family protein [Kribbella sp. VKM Ac-2527]